MSATDESATSSAAWVDSAQTSNREYTASAIQMRKNVIAAAVQMRQNVVAAAIQMRVNVTAAADQMANNASADFARMASAAWTAAGGINAALASITRNIYSTHTITTVHRTAGAPGRADGGPVEAGQRYLVGERGPEYFTPTTPGYVTPNEGGGKANARMIGREVAKALQESPISIPQDAVTDSVLRAAPGREALRGWA